ncbi:MAG: response regulator [Bacilli bacterium]|nr:response regulator [Bacilli bacterium]
MEKAERIPSVAKHRVLIVDDEDINCEILSVILSSEFETFSAHNGQEALDFLTKPDSRISAVLVDLLIPVMDGFTFMREKEKIAAIRGIPVLVLSSEASLEVESLRMGAFDFIKKPYDYPEIILARVRRIVQLYQESALIASTSTDPLTGLFTQKYFDHFTLEKAERGEDLDVLAAHSLKGVAGNLALTKLYGAASALCEKTRDASGEASLEIVSEAKELYALLRSHVATIKENL